MISHMITHSVERRSKHETEVSEAKRIKKLIRDNVTNENVRQTSRQYRRLDSKKKKNCLTPTCRQNE